MSLILETKNLCKHFGGLRAIEGVNLRVERGDLRCLIGPNGAGKSTLFRLIFGEHRPSSGQIFFKGQDVAPLLLYRRASAGMSIKFQVPGIFLGLSVEQNLSIALQRAYDGSDAGSELRRLLLTTDLEPWRGKLASDLSHGQRQWLEMGMALALRPSLLLLDEPTAGMSEAETSKMAALLRELNTNGMTIIAVEHDMAFVKQIASSVTVLHLGEIFAEGTIDEIVDNEGVARIYLGTNE